MVNELSIEFMILTTLVSVFVPIGLLVYFYRVERISFRTVLFGALVFFVFSQILEKLLHVYILQGNTQTAQLMKNSPVIFAIYGALAAGIFEEVGKFIAFRYMLADRHDWKDGMAYGIGHGGIEAIMIGGILSLQNFTIARMINDGILETTFGGKMPQETLNQLKDTLINTPPYLFLISGGERMIALAVQIALSFLILYGVKNGKNIYLLYAILAHALLDLPAGLYQAKLVSIWVSEIPVVLFGVAAGLFIKRSRDFIGSDSPRIVLR